MIKTFRIPENIAISDSGFIFLTTTGETFTINETGKLILKLLQTGKSVEEIIELLKEEYDADVITLERDIQEFILYLQSLNIIVQV